MSEGQVVRKIPFNTGNMQLNQEGIWVSGVHTKKLAYPKTGNQFCFQVEDTSFWFKHRNDCIIAALKLHPPSGPLIDVGGGNGYVTRRILDEGFEAALVEPGTIGAHNAKKQRQIPYVFCSTFEDCHFGPESIDAVGLFDVLEHIEDKASFLSGIHTALKPAGQLYLTVPAFMWLWSSSDDIARHYHRYSPKSLIDSLKKYFDVLFVSCFFQALTLPIFAFRALPYRLGLTTKRAKILSTKTEHGMNDSFLIKVIRRLLSYETKRITSGKSAKWGASCLCIARKADKT